MNNWTPEPWGTFEGRDNIPYLGCSLNRADYDRAAKCVNACAGMDDPAAEIAALRQRIDQITEALHEEYARVERLCSEKDALLCMIREPPCPSYEQLRADNQVMVDALESISSRWDGRGGNFKWIGDIAREALGKTERKEATAVHDALGIGDSEE
jgi:hypothetical protein